MIKLPDNRELAIAELNTYYEFAPDEHIKRLLDLWDYTKEQNHRLIHGIVCYYLGELYFFTDYADTALQYLNEANAVLTEEQDYEYLCKTYNILGLTFHVNGSYFGAVHYYNKGLSLAKSITNYYMEGVIYSNLAILYYEIEDYENSISFRELALELYCQHQVEGRERKIVSQCCGLIAHYIFQKDENKIREYYDLLASYLSQFPGSEKDISVYVAKMQYAYFRGEKNEAYHYLEQALEAFGDYIGWIEFFDELFIIVDFLYEQKEYDRILAVLDHVEEEEPSEESADKMMKFLKYRIAVYEAQGRTEDMLGAMCKHYQYSTLQQQHVRRTYRMALKAQQDLKMEREQNLMLTSLAYTDYLTEIPNRRSLNEKSDEWFDEAKEQGTHLGVEMLDIDFFKQCNDSFGHQKGDECLKALAKAIKSLEEDRVFVSRYGGDEFTILYKDMLDEEILEKANKLKENVAQVMEQIGLPQITISQGIFNNIPIGNNKVWDFKYAADEALYTVKKTGRNHILLVHSAAEAFANRKVDKH